jgi:hypothetical protein
MNKTAIYRTEVGREQVKAYYSKVLATFPFTQRYVDTAFGKTFLLETGPPEKEAVLLLHGSCATARSGLVRF